MSGVSQIGGHGVSGPSLVTANLKWLVHSCAADTLAVCALKDGSSNSTSSPDSDFISTVELVMLPESEQLTVLHLHPTKDLLFVGAKPTGLYLTPVINAELGDDSELLPRSTGNALSATFIDGGEKGSDVLVVSCGHAEGTATEGNTLFIWNVQRRSLLWRGSTEAMISMSPVPGTTGFASCSRKNVFLWNIRRGEGGGYTGGFSNAPVGDGTAKSEVGGDEVITVIRKKCATVKGLRDMEYVSVVPPAASPESSLVLLTAKGFLVSFDIQSGEALKWMDCKISDVATAYQIADDIVVCGNIIRFFSALTWEFRGKIKPSDYFSATNISFPLRFSNLVFKGAATCDKNALALFFSEGFMSRYRVVWPRCVTGRFQSTSVKLSLHRVYQYMPLFLENSPLFWLPLSHDVMCLWSPKKLQLYRVDSWFNTANIDFESNFVAYHRRLNVLVFYIHSTGSLLVLPRRLENAVFLKNMLCRVTVEEPLTTLIGIEANRFVGVSPGNILFYFEGRWDAIELDFHLRQVRATPFSGLTNPLKHLVWTAGVLCAASVRDVVNLHTGRCITLEYDIVGLLAGGDGVLLVIHSHACVFLGATSLKSVGTTILGAAFGGGTTSAEGKLAVVHSDRSVYVVDMVGARCVKHFKASQEAHAVEASTILSAGFTEDGSNIIICDSAGLLKLFKLGDLCTAPCITDGDGTSQDEVSAASFCGENSGFCMGRDEQPEGPTNNQLQTRLQDLNDFYEASRRASSSRRTDGQSNASARDVRRDDDRSSAEKPSEDSPASAHGGTGSIISPSPHEKDPLVSHQESVHSARCWKADEIPAKLPSVAVPVGSGKNDVGVSVSLVEVSALTSVESRQNDFSACTMPEGDAGAVSRSMCDISPNNREEAVGTDVPAYVMRSPTRKGELSMSPNKNPEDDVVNVDSVDGADARQSVHGFRRPADYHDVANDFPIERGTMNTSSSSIRMKSLEIRKGLRELADAYERQGEENEDTVDEETVDELFSIVSRLYTKLQARQNRRSNSSVSITSDLSTASMNAMLAGIHCLQCQNNRIEAQNRDILSRLSSGYLLPILKQHPYPVQQMTKLFVTKLPKNVPSDELKELLQELMPDAKHIQLLLGSESQMHKGHAYVHFATNEAAAGALRRVHTNGTPSLCGSVITIRRASCASDVPDVVAPPLPPPLAHFGHTRCVAVSPPSLADQLKGVVAQCDVSPNLTVVAFESCSEADACVLANGSCAVRCLPPRLPELLAPHGSAKRQREVSPAKTSEGANDGGEDIVETYENLGFVALTPSQLLLVMGDFLEGHGRIAVQDREGHMAVLNLPAYASALDGGRLVLKCEKKQEEGDLAES